MLRRSASQVFGETTPQRQWGPTSSIISSSPSSSLQHGNTELQPSFPRSQAPTSASGPTFNATGTRPPVPHLFPRNQIEAMPPPVENAQLVAAWEKLPPTLVRDSTTRHPVFFTQRLKRAPNGVGAGAWISPVAAGYVFEEQVDARKREEAPRL